MLPLERLVSRGHVGLPLVAVTLALVEAACSSGEDDHAHDSAMSHVHGLGVNPADGNLYVATHHGVFRLAGGELTRQGDRVQDTMGFTVAGPDRFLASGHPDPRDGSILEPGMQPLLGLIESTDKGLSWRGLSLQGQADFHALGFAHDRVYGFDASSGTFMVSSDTMQWESRSRIRLSSFAVSPLDRERILGSLLDDSVATSHDGGRSWTPAGGAVPLAFVSWNRERGLWGVARDGVAFRSTDDGATWVRAGKAHGSPTAFVAEAQALFVATSDAIFRSSDDGSTWVPIYEKR